MENKKQEKNTKKEYNEFRTLLRKGIGTRSQADFAKELGWAPSRVNTMLKPKLIAQPTPSVLRTLAKHMTEVTLDDLLLSCGYATGIEATAADILSSMREYFTGKGGQPKLFRNFLDSLQMFSENQSPPNISKLKLSIAGQTNNLSKSYPEAEKEQHIDVSWRYMNRGYHMSVIVYLLQTLSGKTLIFGIEAKRNEDCNLASRCESSYMMGDTAQYVYLQELKAQDVSYESDGYKLYPAVYSGPGLLYDETPPRFTEFLERHKDTFCISDERTELWTRAVTFLEDPDVVFSDFGEGGWNSGTGAVVASILTDELRDLPELENDRFVYVHADEDSKHSYVMIIKPPKSIPSVSKEMEDKLDGYAVELDIPAFGLCYYQTTVYNEPSLWHQTDTYFAASDDYYMDF